MLAPDAQGKTPLWLTARHLGRKLFTKLWKRHKSRQALAEGGRAHTHTSRTPALPPAPVSGAWPLRAARSGQRSSSSRWQRLSPALLNLSA